jgi:ribosomal protein S18 acetylase RimI-like enzyme
MTLDDARGRRIVVRHRLPGRGPSGGPALNDVVGRLVELTTDEALVERRDGSVARVPLADVVTWKPVPERPVRRRPALSFSPDELSRITSRGWPAIVSEPLGEWELRASQGFTGRACSVAAHGDPGLPFDEALQVVHAFYARHDLPPLAQVVVGSPEDRAFADAGWTLSTSTRPGAIVQVADLTDDHVADPDVRIGSRADDAWLARYGRVGALEAAARAVLEGPSTVGFAALGDVAVGRVVVTGQWAGLSAVEVDPQRRREGLAGRVVTTMLRWAVEHGADKAYLQTMRDNEAAIALYAPFGFVDHHEYRYLAPSGGHTLTA